MTSEEAVLNKSKRQICERQSWVGLASSAVTQAVDGKVRLSLIAGRCELRMWHY